ncbi:unnamed protein product [Prunus armeniaca]
MGEMECLHTLHLNGTAIRQLPCCIVGLKKLRDLSLGGRSGLQPNKSRFWWGLPRLNGRKAFVLASLDGLFSLKYLDLSNCGICEGDLPRDIGCLSSLEKLSLSGNNFVSLPASIGCLSKLKLFWVNGCQSLEQLPDLSKLISLVDINIANCTSLKMPLYGFTILTPGRKIPEWFSNQSLGDSLIVELPTTWMGIAFCAVFEVQANLSDVHYFRINCSPPGMRTHGVFPKEFTIGDVVSDHLWVIYASRIQSEKICGQIKFLFTTYYSHQDIMLEHKKSCVKKCGFRLVHEQDVEQLNQIMMNKSIIKSTTTCPTKSADAQGQQRHDDEEASPSGSGSSHQKSLFCNTYALSKEADQDELNDVVDEARPRKRKKIDVIGTNL